MIKPVDAQIQRVLAAALPGYSPTGTVNPSTTTAVIFLSDHGEYGGSHGLQGKSCAVYDEALRVPFYVMLPGQSGAIQQSQMCSMVDVFRFIVELAVGAVVPWTTHSAYKDQANRQSLFEFIFVANSTETRTINIHGTSTPYILSTSDEIPIDGAYSPPRYQCGLHNHVICLRTKSLDDITNRSTYYSGSKYAIYSKWVYGNGPDIDGSVAQQIEFYDYTPPLGNRVETTNNYIVSSPGTSLQAAMAGALGNGPVTTGSSTAPATGLVASELEATLTGVTRDGTFSLSSITNVAFNSTVRPLGWNHWSTVALTGVGCSS